MYLLDVNKIYAITFIWHLSIERNVSVVERRGKNKIQHHKRRRKKQNSWKPTNLLIILKPYLFIIQGRILLKKKRCWLLKFHERFKIEKEKKVLWKFPRTFSKLNFHYMIVIECCNIVIYIFDIVCQYTVFCVCVTWKFQ